MWGCEGWRGEGGEVGGGGGGGWGEGGDAGWEVRWEVRGGAEVWNGERGRGRGRREKRWDIGVTEREWMNVGVRFGQ